MLPFSRFANGRTCPRLSPFVTCPIAILRDAIFSSQPERAKGIETSSPPRDPLGDGTLGDGSGRPSPGDVVGQGRLRRTVIAGELVDMKLENEKTIAAAPAVVWGVTVDIEHWPEWTPTVESVVRLDEGPFDVGSTARIKQPGLPEAVWRVTALEVGAGFTWETRVRGMRMVAAHELTPAGEGTKNTLRLEITGVVAVLLWPLIRRSVRRALEQENTGLKAACEAIVNSGERTDDSA